MSSDLKNGQRSIASALHCSRDTIREVRIAAKESASAFCWYRKCSKTHYIRLDFLSRWMFPSPVLEDLPLNPGSVYDRLQLILEHANCKQVRFHDLRHPYVKHTTKIFSLRLMDFQAQAYPDARRKTRGACQLLRVGQSQSPVRPLCNRKRFSCSPPQSKMSWILYAISMRLSGYTSTRSISISASSVVSVSASKITLDASLRLSCRACSSCFCFACANTAP